MTRTISHSWRNGGDDSRKPTVELLDSGHALITADADCDADGSPRATTIDPDSGQLETSLRRYTGWAGEGEHVNSEVVPYYVLPLNWASVTGIAARLGDIAKLSYGQYSVYAIYADQGPNELIGETSIATLEALGFNPWNSSHSQVVAGIPHGVKYEVVPISASLKRTVDFESIQAYGKEVFGVESNPAKRFPSATPQPGGKMEILDTCSVSGEDLNLYLISIGKKSYADTDMGGSYAKWGKQYGVNYIGAFAQMLHETANLNFGHDVKPGQNNFAGIGATGGGVPGESFASIHLGVGAQIQHLAVYAGKEITKTELIAKRTAEVYSIILHRSETFEGLAGTWAADTGYWPKVKAKLDKVNAFISENEPTPQPQPTPVGKVTWFEFNRYDDGTPSCMGYAGDKPAEEYKGKSVEELSAFFKKHPSAKSFLVADVTKVIPTIEPVGPDPEPQPEPDSHLPGLTASLKKGDKGPTVELLQKELNEHFDAQLTVDGDFGPATDIAVRKVEGILGTTPNGIVEADLWKAIGTLRGLKQDITPTQPATAGWIPFARTPSNDSKIAGLNAECGGKYPTHFTYEGGWPTGAIVHFTAGSDADGYGTLRYLSGVDDNGEHNYPCLLLGRGGNLLQAFPASRGGAHSGTSHHDYCVGIEVSAAGICTKLADGTFKTWFGKILPASEMRYAARNAAEHIYEGWYQIYTSAQETTLIRTILWYKWADPTGRFSFDKVIGHDHACDVGGNPGNKSDPGGALSMSMSAFRALLKKKYEELMQSPVAVQKEFFGVS